mmetsp:Transcript_7751/g.20289  ORF Transcript_7751/g.20289 Transcript_7751/m.20289 type:complete len:225 (-) Transcript_7751:3081-3755(-)
MLFTHAELLKLHSSFGHAPAARIWSHLLKARPNTNPGVKDDLEAIRKHCEACQRYSHKPSRFRASVVPNNLQFNDEVEVDIWFIDSDIPVATFHCRQTGWGQSSLLRDNKYTAENVWRAMLIKWICVSPGWMRVLATYQGATFTSSSFNTLCQTAGVSLKSVAVEAHNAIGGNERSHGVVRQIFNKLRTEANHNRDDLELTIGLAHKAKNDTANEFVLEPTLLV